MGSGGKRVWTVVKRPVRRCSSMMSRTKLDLGLGSGSHQPLAALLMRATTRSRPRTSIISNRPAPLVLPLTAMRAGWMIGPALMPRSSANSRKTASIASWREIRDAGQAVGEERQVLAALGLLEVLAALLLDGEIVAEEAVGHGREFAQGLEPDLVEVEDLGQVGVGDAGGRCRPPRGWLLDEGEEARVRGLHDVFGVEPAELLDVELGLDVVHLRDLEEPDGLVGGHDLAAVLGHPAEEDEVVGQGLGQEALALVLLDGDAAVALGELGPVRARG